MNLGQHMSADAAKQGAGRLAALSRGCGLTAKARLDAFRGSRSIWALFAVVAFPLLAFPAGEPVAVTAAMLLAGLLAFVIAQETGRPGRLARGLILSQLALAALLAAAVLRGLPPAAAAGLIAAVGVETFLLGGRRLSRLGPGIALCSLAGVGVASSVALDSPAPFSGALAWLMAAATMATLILVLGASLSRRTAESVSSDLSRREWAGIGSETIISADATGGVLRVGSNARYAIGFAPQELMGRGLLEMTLVSDRPMLLAELSAAAHGGAPVVVRFRLRVSAANDAPSYRWVEAQVAPSPAAKGVAVLALRDAGAMITQEDRLQRALEDAAKARGARAAFLSTINHELRTPLNAVLGFSEVLAGAETRPADPGRIGEYASLIHGAGKDLLRTINAMIDVTRLESGVYEFDAEAGDIGDAIEAAVSAFRDENPGVEIRVDIPQAPVQLPFDGRALRTVIHELLSNAAKFGRRGGLIRIGLRQEPRQVQLFIRDEGVGLASEKIAMLGRHFARLDDGLAREQGGVGLGLSLVHGLTALHGGRVTIASTAGVGTTVTVTLPLDPTETSSATLHRLERPRSDTDAQAPLRPVARKERLRA